MNMSVKLHGNFPVYVRARIIDSPVVRLVSRDQVHVFLVDFVDFVLFLFFCWLRLWWLWLWVIIQKKMKLLKFRIQVENSPLGTAFLYMIVPLPLLLCTGIILLINLIYFF